MEKKIETFFLNFLLRIIISGTLLVLIANLLFFSEDALSISIRIAILGACLIAFIFRHDHPTLSVLIMTSTALIAMVYQRLAIPSTSSTLSIILIIGFVFSILLKGRIMWVMHCITFAIINSIFIYNQPDAFTAAITYSTLYFTLTYSTAVLKYRYDKINQYYRASNIQLTKKAKKIEEQNRELIQFQEELSNLNMNLEKLINERTTKIRNQNQALIKYSYTNAHHLRGPVARLLGLASVYRLEPKPNPEFFMKKMIEQAHEIDSVIKKINIELALNIEEKEEI